MKYGVAAVGAIRNKLHIVKNVVPSTVGTMCYCGTKTKSKQLFGDEWFENLQDARVELGTHRFSKWMCQKCYLKAYFELF